MSITKPINLWRKAQKKILENGKTSQTHIMKIIILQKATKRFAAILVKISIPIFTESIDKKTVLNLYGTTNRCPVESDQTEQYLRHSRFQNYIPDPLS